MTPELWETAHAAEYRREFKEMGSERVDRGTGRHGRWEIVFAACEGFDTTDREAYLEHMATLHNRKPGGPLQIKLGRGHWRAPKLYDAGAPFKAPDGLTETCASCGLVSEIPPKPLDSPYRDHVEHCPGMKREVA
jgi:hypothetical protein